MAASVGIAVPADSGGSMFGFYFAPSQFEAGFVSGAHGDKDIEATATVFGEVIAAG